ncbi:hypothetical protein C8Q78DRAFT_704387 [Trametes maxima]|nr:hypothetical protein C8Q78DRAFT_704387 [Trametes maxima]
MQSSLSSHHFNRTNVHIQAEAALIGSQPQLLQARSEPLSSGTPLYEACRRFCILRAGDGCQAQVPSRPTVSPKTLSLKLPRLPGAYSFSQDVRSKGLIWAFSPARSPQADLPAYQISQYLIRWDRALRRPCQSACLPRHTKRHEDRNSAQVRIQFAPSLCFAFSQADVQRRSTLASAASARRPSPKALSRPRLLEADRLPFLSCAVSCHTNAPTDAGTQSHPII